MDIDRAWELNPQVALRPEPFGALVYHFGTRKLSFLKDRRLLETVRTLDREPSARAALVAAGVGDHEMTSFTAALSALADSDMVKERAA